MVRLGLFGLICAALVILANPFADLGADPAADADAAFKNTLLVQGAMEQARCALVDKADAKQAVQILEEHLARINGNPVYLGLLRQAYRAHINDLHLAHQDSLAQKYEERLAILDRGAMRDISVRPSAAEKVVQDAKALTKAVTAPAAKLVNKGLDLAQQVNPLPKMIGSPASKPATVRAKVEEDPFDLSFKRSPPASGRQEQARQFLAQADAEFSKRRFSQARLLYEQAHQADQTSTAVSYPRWAYCKLNHVVEQLNDSKVNNSSLPALQKEVHLAMEMAPSLSSTGKWLLQEIDQREKSVPAPARADAPAPANDVRFPIQHAGRNAQGWQVAETAHFRIFHHQTREFADKVARVAERTRLEMYRKWFGNDGSEWKPKCDLYLHDTGRDYSRATGVPGQSPGHSRFENEGNGRVVDRRMDLHCDVPTMLEAVLPHETTHVVLAGQFGRHAIPRWADEGMAVLTEPEDKIDQHRRNLVRSQREGQLYSVRDLMNLADYPPHRRINAFYAQSVVLVDFLTRQRGPRVFAEFLRDGLQGGYEQALKKHYGFRDFNDLQVRWNQQVLAEVHRIEPGFAGR